MPREHAGLVWKDRWTRYRENVRPADVFMLLWQSIFLCFEAETMHQWRFGEAMVWFIGIIIALCLVAPALQARVGARWADTARLVAACLSSVASYEQANMVLQHYGFVDQTPLVAALDLQIFGGHASVAAQAFAVPWFVELLQITYMVHIVPIFVVGSSLILRGRHVEYSALLFQLLCAVFLVAAGYALIPVQSPCYVEGAAYARELGLVYAEPLQGLWWTDDLRARLLAATDLRHDCMPSGHTTITLLPAVWAWRRWRRLATPLTVFTGLTMLATLVLRYHWLIDLVAAWALVLALQPVLGMVERGVRSQENAKA